MLMILWDARKRGLKSDLTKLSQIHGRVKQL